MANKEILDIMERSIRIVNELISWRSIALLCLISFRKEIRRSISGLAERVKSVEIAGSKLNFSDSASRALANVLRELAESDKSDRDIQNVLLSLSSKIPQIGKKHPMEATKILWVDDNPDNNIFEINLLQEMGIGVELFLSTDEAVEYLKTGDPIDLIISDIKRGEDDNAGYEFLDFLRGNQAYKDIPLVFYMGNVNWVQKDRVRKAQGCADTPDALIRYIKAALKKS